MNILADKDFFNVEPTFAPDADLFNEESNESHNDSFEEKCQQYHEGELKEYQNSLNSSDFPIAPILEEQIPVVESKKTPEASDEDQISTNSQSDDSLSASTPSESKPAKKAGRPPKKLPRDTLKVYQRVQAILQDSLHEIETSQAQKKKPRADIYKTRIVRLLWKLPLFLMQDKSVVRTALYKSVTLSDFSKAFKDAFEVAVDVFLMKGVSMTHDDKTMIDFCALHYPEDKVREHAEDLGLLNTKMEMDRLTLQDSGVLSLRGKTGIKHFMQMAKKNEAFLPIIDFVIAATEEKSEEFSKTYETIIRLRKQLLDHIAK